MKEIQSQLTNAITFLVQNAPLKQGDVIVFGASTSEVAGGQIGHNSVPELGAMIANTIIDTCESLGVHPVFQCCEHLNRALVMEKDLLTRLSLTQVNARPMPKAGGSVPTGAYERFQNPALAMNIQADAVIDIGDTLVGMHIRPVAVPLRIPSLDRIGQAHLVMAYARLPYVGGCRAQYV